MIQWAVPLMTQQPEHFTYFSEIEEHFSRRRGTVLIVSTLDWALMETWKDAGVPLEAVLRGIDATFERYDARPSKTRKVNSLAYCAQEVLAAAEEMKAAAEGAAPAPSVQPKDTGFAPHQIAEYLSANAAKLDAAAPEAANAAGSVMADAASTLRDLAAGLTGTESSKLEDIERRLTVIEEKVIAALLASTPDEALLTVRAEVDRDVAPFRRNMPSAQVEQLHKQYVQKRLLERYKLPRLSLFYM
jgi:hypothetical protein